MLLRAVKRLRQEGFKVAVSVHYLKALPESSSGHVPTGQNLVVESAEGQLKS